MHSLLCVSVGFNCRFKKDQFFCQFSIFYLQNFGNLASARPTIEPIKNGIDLLKTKKYMPLFVILLYITDRCSHKSIEIIDYCITNLSISFPSFFYFFQKNILLAILALKKHSSSTPPHLPTNDLVPSITRNCYCLYCRCCTPNPHKCFDSQQQDSHSTA